jgi:protein TonB
VFDSVLIESQARRGKPWAVVASLIAQCCALSIAILIPLIYTYEIPAGEWLGRALLLVPPPPPPLRAVEVKAETPQAPKRFDAVFRQPSVIPEQVSILDDSLDTSSSAALPDLQGRGVQGAPSDGFADGVLGLGQLASLENLPPPARVRIGGHVQQALLIHKVSPVYPVEALKAGLTGRVEVEALISVQGLIREVQVLSGDPLLVDSVVQAVKQWRYQPTTLNGRKVEVITRIEIFFKFTEPKQDPKGKRKSKKRNKATG